MYLTANQTSLLGRLMATLAEPQNELEIRARVGHLVLDLLGAQHYASYVWDDAQRRFDAGVHINMDEANTRRYRDYFQFNDPITFKLQRHRKAVRVTDVMPQSELKQTEFFSEFLACDGLYWGVNLYAWSGPDNIGDMRIWRDKRRENFSNDDLELLNWAAAGFVDTSLSFLSFLELYRTDVAQRRMTAPGVVEALDVIEHIRPGLLSAAVDLPGNAFRLH